MLNFRSVFKCKAPCHCHSRASGTSHSPQRGRSLTANLTWNCSLTEGLSLFYRWRLGLNFFHLHCGTQAADGSGSGTEVLSLLSVLVQMWKGRLAFAWLKCWSPIRWRIAHGFAMWRRGGQGNLSWAAHQHLWDPMLLVTPWKGPVLLFLLQPCGISQITSPQRIMVLLAPFTLKAYKILMRLFYCIWLHLRSTDTLGHAVTGKTI